MLLGQNSQKLCYAILFLCIFLSSTASQTAISTIPNGFLAVSPESSNFFQEELHHQTISPLHVNETAILNSQTEVLLGNGTIPGYDSENLSYYIDDLHGWSADTVNSTISHITDERDWIKQGTFDITTLWSYWENDVTNSEQSGGAGSIGGKSGIWSRFDGYIQYVPTRYTYYENDACGYKQTVSVPRGKLIDAWVELSYYLENGLDTNDIYFTVEIDSQSIYSKGFRSITTLGQDQWHNTGKINKLMWENSSAVFPNILNGNSFEFSVGLECGRTDSYESEAGRVYQLIYFDDIKLYLKTEANATQSLIEIKFDGEDVTTGVVGQSGWGFAQYTKTGLWESNPMEIEMTTTGSKLTYDVNSTIHLNHYSNSTVAQYGAEGASLSILSNDKVKWEFYHNAYHPSQYEDYEFFITKPETWNITNVLDPTGLATPFQFGNPSQTNVTVTKDYATFLGWWKFQAESPNLINKSFTNIGLNENWYAVNQDIVDVENYNINDNLTINTKIDQRYGAISDIESSFANLTVYYPNGSLYFFESINPDADGNINFTKLLMGAYNTTGGFYSYKITWNKNEFAGGLYGYFRVTRELEADILIPSVSESLSISVTQGDIITFRIRVHDKYNAQLIDTAKITLELVGGTLTKNLAMNQIGVYEGFFDSSDFGDIGNYQIKFNISTDDFWEIELLFNVEVKAPIIPEVITDWIKDYWWVLVLMAAAVLTLGFLLFHQTITVPKRKRAEEALSLKIQVFEDVENIRGVMIIHKESGLSIYHHEIRALASDETLVTGFLQAIIMFSKNLSGDENASESLDFTHENFQVLIQDGEQIRVAMILEKKASNTLRNNVRSLTQALDKNFKHEFKKWDGNATQFNKPIHKLIVEHLYLYLNGPLRHNDEKFGNLWVDAKPAKNYKEESILSIIRSISWGKDGFYIAPMLKSLRKEEVSQTKEILLDLIHEKRIVPFEPEPNSSLLTMRNGKQNCAPDNVPTKNGGNGKRPTDLPNRNGSNGNGSNRNGSSKSAPTGNGNTNTSSNDGDWFTENE